MNAQFIPKVKFLFFLIVFMVTLIKPTPSISHENLAVIFEDSETRIPFFAKFENNRELSDQVPLTALAQFQRSVIPFRQNLTAGGERKGVPIIMPIWGGILGASVGFFGGALVGAAAFGNGYGSIYSSVIGAVISESLVMPLGVHYGNKKRGKLGIDLLTSIAVAGGGLLIFDALNANESWLLLIPVLQIGATVTVELVTARQK